MKVMSFGVRIGIRRLPHLRFLVLSLGGCTKVIKDVVEVLEGRSLVRDLLPTVQHDVV